MLRPALLSLSLLATLTACSDGTLPKAASAASPMASASAALGEAVVLPAYTRWSEANRALADSARALCAGEQPLSEARQHYLTLHHSWAALQPVAFGPLAEGNLAWQVQFWPDKKNLVARQVKTLLDTHTDLKPADLAQASVVLQGLTAYEYLLFDASINLEALEQKRRYCPLLLGIATHQQALSTRVLGQWLGPQGLATQLREFPNPRYAEDREAIAELLRTQVTALDMLKRKLGTPLPQSGQPAQPYQAEAWRSGASLTLIDSTLASAQQLWQVGLRGLLTDEQADLRTRLDAGWNETRQRLAALGAPLSELLASEEGRTSLVTLYSSLEQLHRLHEAELARALDITLGFNAHDGD